MVDRKREAGLNRSLKLIRRGKVKKVWVASDADLSFVDMVEAEILAKGLSPDRSKTGQQLACMCGVEVFTAIVVEKISDTNY